ncbi:unnamed protein product [Prorocentrum cordatum]|uniref:Uncharacterized protein n=1 Tax=Prorocentrum cordatum TaxID=2364126 RepID=A0ABN9TW49_9DINO|nr:unnamed protein product [Polarella glacialis]
MAGIRRKRPPGRLKRPPRRPRRGPQDGLEKGVRSHFGSSHFGSSHFDSRLETRVPTRQAPAAARSFARHARGQERVPAAPAPPRERLRARGDRPRAGAARAARAARSGRGGGAVGGRGGAGFAGCGLARGALHGGRDSCLSRGYNCRGCQQCERRGSQRDRSVLADGGVLRLANLPSAVLSLARSATRRTTIGARATKLATHTVCGRLTDGSRRTRQSGTARRFGRRARQLGRLAHCPSAALSQGRRATRRMTTGSRATKLAIQTTCGWRNGWVKTNETVWDCEVISIDSTDVSSDSDVSIAAGADVSADAASSSDVATASVCSPNGESCALTMCCADPDATCYKKNDYWFACNQTCDPNSMWMEDGWVKTDEAVWDCGEHIIDESEDSQTFWYWLLRLLSR